MTAAELRVVPVAPDDTALIEAWYAAYVAADRHGREEHAAPFHLAELRALLEEPGRARTVQTYAGMVGDRVAVAASIELPRLTNLDTAAIELHTVPELRRRGLGSAMLEHLEGVARARGRSILNAESSWPYAGGPTGAGHAGPGFLVAHGFRLGLGDVHRVLDLPVPERLLDELAAAAAPHHPAYTLRSWVGPVPDELVESWARLVSTLATEAPTGELQVEPDSPDPAVVREDEALIARQGRTKVNTVALDVAGEVVAYTDVATSVHEPERALQWGTLVRRDHRGHRLGLAVKVANLRLLQARRPDLRRLATYNAEVNAHMVGVNELLGFRPVERLGEFQKRLD